MKRRFSLLNKDIGEVIKKGQKYQNTLFYSRFLYSNSLKFAFSPTKKLFPKAVDRNRAKRLLKESFSARIMDFLPVYCVIFPSLSLITASNKEINEAVIDFANKIKQKSSHNS